MTSAREPWKPNKCGDCGKVLGPKDSYIWNGKSRAESRFVCRECATLPKEPK